LAESFVLPLEVESEASSPPPQAARRASIEKAVRATTGIRVRFMI
jgi:hypothetical protein